MVYFLVFINAVFISFFLLSRYPVLPAFDDNYFYLKLAQLFNQQGFFYKLPWLYYSNYKDAFTGHHFLYWLFMVPFLKVLNNDVLGAKIYQSLIFGLMNLLIFFIFKRVFRVNNKFSCFFIFLLYSLPTAFLWRMINIRPLAFSLIFLLLIFLFLKKRNYILLWLTNFFFVWAYDGYLLSAILLLLWSLSNYLTRQQIYLKPLLVGFSAILWGLIFNPFFPANVLFVHLFKVNPLTALFSFGISAEWLPPNIKLLPFGYESVVTYLFFALLIGFWLWLKKTTKNINYFEFLISIFFSVLSLFYIRFLDYAVPFTLILLSSIWGKLFYNLPAIKFKNFFITWIIFYFTLSLLVNFKDLNFYLKNQPPFLRYQKVSEFLNKNTQKREIIFNTDWSTFPALFYANDYNYYVAGLGMQFLKAYNEKLAFVYQSINKGLIYCQSRNCRLKANYCDLYLDKKYAQAIKYYFNSSIIFLDLYQPSQQDRIFNILNHSKYFIKIYEGENYDKGVYVFRILI